MNWDSLQDLIALRERQARRAAPPESGWAPSVDLLETDGTFVVFVELSGLSAHDFAISATQDSLTISGERPATTPPPQRYVRLERGQGRFSRSFSFGQSINAEQIAAVFERGVLTITVPKTTVRTEHRIPIS
ncbi:MAG: Hsp20/alpha crystallin family protein [Vicinamibacterales bacterium]